MPGVFEGCGENFFEKNAKKVLRKHFSCAILTLSARRKGSDGWQTSKSNQTYTTMKTNSKNWTKYTCENLDEVAMKLGVDLSGYPVHTAASKDVTKLYDALLNKYGMDSNVLYLVQVDSIPTIDNECYYELAVSPKYEELQEIA